MPETRNPTPALLRTPDLRRRVLLLGLPGGLMLGSPLAILGCGGNGGDAGAVPDKVLQVPDFTVSPRRVQVALPGSSGIAVQSTRLATAQSICEVAADGTAAMLALDDAPQMAYLLGPQGELLLMGWLGDGASRIDVRSTAEALLYLVSRVDQQQPALRIALRDALRQLDFVEPVAAQVAAGFGPVGLSSDNAALMQALQAAAAQMLPRPAAAPAMAGIKRPADLHLPSPGPRSGIELVADAAFNTVVIRNHFRRRAWAWVERVGHVDSAGGAVTLPTPQPMAPVEGFDISATTALSLDNLVIAAGDLLLGLVGRIGLLGDYAYGTAPWSAVDAPPFYLPLDPTDARQTDYRVRVIGPGAGDSGALDDAEGTKLGELLAATLFDDILTPIVSTFFLPAIGKKAGEAFQSSVAGLFAVAFAKDLAKIEVQRQYLPNTVRALRKGDYNTAVFEFCREFFTSDVWGKILEEGLKAAVNTFTSTTHELRDPNGQLIGANLVTEAAQRADAVKSMARAMGKLSVIKEVIEKGALALDLIAIAKDLSGSSVKESFDASAAALRVTLTPKTAQMLPPGSGIQNFTATLASNTGGETTDPSAYTYEWACDGAVGEINDGGNNIGAHFTSTSNVVGFAPNGKAVAGDLVTVTVKVFRINATSGGGKQSLVGQASATLRFKKEFTLELSPADTIDLPTDTSFPLLARLREKAPAGAALTVDWRWSVSGSGSLSANPNYASLYARDPSMSNQDLKTGSTEGTARVTVSAVVSVSATDAAPAHSVETDPVSLLVNLKSNLETIRFTPPGGAFACSDTKACGVSSYGAYIVPVLERAVSYTAVFTGFGYAGCNRSVTWTAPVPDGGDCNFPITYHPHNSVGPTNLWAVWLGFGDTWAPDGSCEVTIVLRKP